MLCAFDCFRYSVGNAIKLTGGSDVQETSKFVLLLDKFFNVLNVSNFDNWARS